MTKTMKQDFSERIEGTEEMCLVKVIHFIKYLVSNILILNLKIIFYFILSKPKDQHKNYQWIGLEK